MLAMVDMCREGWPETVRSLETPAHYSKQLGEVPGYVDSISQMSVKFLKYNTVDYSSTSTQDYTYASEPINICASLHEYIHR